MVGSESMYTQAVNPMGIRGSYSTHSTDEFVARREST